MNTPDLPPSDQARSYFCNKCGFIGPTDHALDGSNNCHYCAIPFGPFWGAQKMIEYGDARASAAVLAEREKSEAVRAALRALTYKTDAITAELERLYRLIEREQWGASQ